MVSNLIQMTDKSGLQLHILQDPIEASVQQCKLLSFPQCNSKKYLKCELNHAHDFKIKSSTKF